MSTRPGRSRARSRYSSSSSSSSSASSASPSHSPPPSRLSPPAANDATDANIILFLIGFRILNSLTVRTFFQPDEFFQSLEPAWKIAFGEDQGPWITWVSCASRRLSTASNSSLVGMEASAEVVAASARLRCRLFRRRHCCPRSPAVPSIARRLSHCRSRDSAGRYRGRRRLLYLEAC